MVQLKQLGSGLLRVVIRHRPIHSEGLYHQPAADRLHYVPRTAHWLTGDEPLSKGCIELAVRQWLSPSPRLRLFTREVALCGCNHSSMVYWQKQHKGPAYHNITAMILYLVADVRKDCGKLAWPHVITCDFIDKLTSGLISLQPLMHGAKLRCAFPLRVENTRSLPEWTCWLLSWRSFCRLCHDCIYARLPRLRDYS